MISWLRNIIEKLSISTNRVDSPNQTVKFKGNNNTVSQYSEMGKKLELNHQAEVNYQQLLGLEDKKHREISDRLRQDIARVSSGNAYQSAQGTLEKSLQQEVTRHKQRTSELKAQYDEQMREIGKLN